MDIYTSLHKQTRTLVHIETSVILLISIVVFILKHNLTNIYDITYMYVCILKH